MTWTSTAQVFEARMEMLAGRRTHVDRALQSPGDAREEKEAMLKPDYEREGVRLTFGSLFAGIGGFDLGFERAGMTCKWQVEIDPFCRNVLAKHWPDVRRHDDVRTFAAGDCDGLKVDVICGGFPCQDISNAGKRAGIDGERSGLWSEYARIIRVLGPKYVVVENVEALAVRGLGRVLGDLADLGYDAEWQSIPASSFGCLHERRRLWVCAHMQKTGCKISLLGEGDDWGSPLELRRLASLVTATQWWRGGERPEGLPRVLRMAHGLPNGVDRIGACGNSVVPKVAEWIGDRILAAEVQAELFGANE